MDETGVGALATVIAVALYMIFLGVMSRVVSRRFAAWSCASGTQVLRVQR